MFGDDLTGGYFLDFDIDREKIARYGLAIGDVEYVINNQGDLTEVIVEGAGQRIRPMLMTGMALLLGLIPIMWSTGSGADVMKRIAAPMVGGIGSALFMVLVVFPAIFALWKGRDVSREQSRS